VGEAINSVRVYANLRSDVGRHPISACVAGQMRSMRLDGHVADSDGCDRQVADSDGCDRLNVIEIPLKSSPKSVAVNGSNGNFAVALQTRVLIYGLSGTKVAASQQYFRWL